MAKSSRRSFGQGKPDPDDAASNDALNESGIEPDPQETETSEIGDASDQDLVTEDDVDANMVELAERHAQEAAGEQAPGAEDGADLDDSDDDDDAPDPDDDDIDDDDDDESRVVESAAAVKAKKKVKDTKSKAAKDKAKKSKDRKKSKSQPSAEPAQSRGVARFVRETYAELTKVVWPTKKQMVTYTIVVMVFVVALVVLVGFFDIGVKDLMAKIFA